MADLISNRELDDLVLLDGEQISEEGVANSLSSRLRVSATVLNLTLAAVLRPARGVRTSVPGWHGYCSQHEYIRHTALPSPASLQPSLSPSYPQDGKMYTSIGPVLISVNPYKLLCEARTGK